MIHIYSHVILCCNYENDKSSILIWVIIIILTSQNVNAEIFNSDSWKSKWFFRYLECNFTSSQTKVILC